MKDKFQDLRLDFDVTQYTADEWHALKQRALQSAHRERSKAIYAALAALNPFRWRKPTGSVSPTPAQCDTGDGRRGDIGQGLNKRSVKLSFRPS
ncbi:MAG: hypothetical protein AAF414_03725 [Pseudomonadota bacterium]